MRLYFRSDNRTPPSTPVFISSARGCGAAKRPEKGVLSATTGVYMDSDVTLVRVTPAPRCEGRRPALRYTAVRHKEVGHQST